MKIAYVLSGTGIQGGATKSLMNLLKGVYAHNDDAILICPNKNGIYEFVSKNNFPGVKAEYINYSYNILPFLNTTYDYLMFCPRLLKRMIKNYIGTYKLIKLCRKENVDLIHSNTSVNDVGYRAAKKLGLPHIWHIREYGKLDFDMIVPFQRKMFLSPNNYTVTITKDIAKYKKLPLSPQHIVIYNGICNTDSFRIKDTDDNYFLYAGNVSKNKGIFDLLEAFSLYLRSNPNKIVVLKIAGNILPEIKTKIHSICNNNTIDKYVEILGPRDDIADLMFCAKAVIVPSFFEGFGRVLPEAMTNGCLTVGRNTAGTKEQYDNGVEITGREIGFRFNNVKELSSILIDIASKSKKDFIGMILDSQTVVRQLYSNEAYTSNIIKLYKNILHPDEQT